MHRIFVIIVCLLAGFWTGWAAEEPTLAVNRDSLYEGESVLLTLNVPDADESTQPDLSAISDAKITFLGKKAENRFQVTIVNGRMERQGFSGYHYFYEVLPLKTGVFMAGPVRVTVKGKTWTLPAKPIVMREIPRQDTVLLDVQAEPETVLPDETFTVTVRLRIKRLAPPYADTPPFLPGDPPQLSASFLDPNPIEGLESGDIRNTLERVRVDPRSPGFRINSYAEERNPFDMGSLFDMRDPFEQRPNKYLPNPQPVEVNGVPYLEFRISQTFKALEEGAYNFGPAGLKGRILTGVDEVRQPLSLDLFAVGRAVTVRAALPPETNRPASFFGITGSNLVADAQLNTGVCRVGDPLKLTLKIRGPLNWRQAMSPNLAAVSNLATRFQVYGSTLQTDKTEDGREYTFTLRPLEPGTIEVPPISIAWFDTGTRTFQTVQTAPIPLKVDPAAELMAGSWLDARSETDPLPTAPAFSKIPAAFRGGADGAVPFRVSRGALALALAGPLFFAGMGAWDALRRSWARHRRGRRRRNALKKALRRLDQLSHDRQEAPRFIARRGFLLLRDFAGDLLDCDSSGLTPPESARLLAEHPVPDALIREFERALTALFEAAYSPNPPPEATQAVMERLPGLLTALDGALQARRSTRTAVPRILLIGLACLGGAAWGAEPGSERYRFAWEEAQSIAGNATSPAHFRRAADRYAALVRHGGRQGDLFYNLGTSLLMAGEPGPALRALVRAERYLGRPPDLVRNMTLARTALNDGEPAPLPWDRVLLAFHFAQPLDRRIGIAALGLFLLGLSGAWVSRSARPASRALFWAAVLTVLLAGSSAVVSLFQEYHESPAVFITGENNHAPS